MHEDNPWNRAVRIAGLAIDHIGIVVPELSPTLAWLRGLGLRVNDGVPLMGEHGPLGQTSAHCVFTNGYVEISAPDRGSGNHLEPLLEHGPGIRILALASDDIIVDHARFAALGLAAGAPRPSSRAVRLLAGERIARFNWFPLMDVVPGAITAVVQHLSRDIVFAPELADHPSGASRLADVLFGGAASTLAQLETCALLPLPAALSNGDLPPGMAGFSVAGLPPRLHVREGFSLRTLL